MSAVFGPAGRVSTIEDFWGATARASKLAEMLLPVCVDAAGNEWSLVELQGELLGAERLGGVEIGSLRFAGGAPTLRVGNHILAGKVAPLAKPFAVLHKMAGGDGGEVRYEVVGVARTRLVFATRPKPVLE